MCLVLIGFSTDSEIDDPFDREWSFYV